jgi:hypothetical protein
MARDTTMALAQSHTARLYPALPKRGLAEKSPNADVALM